MFASNVWGYAGALADGDTAAAAVITTWGVVVPTATDVTQVLGALRTGLNAGHTVAAVNASSGNLRLAVFGEPDSTVPALPSGVRSTEYSLDSTGLSI